MQYSIATPSEFSRVVTVTIPAADLEKEYKKTIKHLASTRKIDGFRKGKLPKDLVVQYFGSQAMNDSVNALLGKYYTEYLSEKKPAGACTPKIQIKGSVEIGKDLEMDILYDEFPEISLKDFSELTIDKPKVTISDDDIDSVIEVIRSQFAALEEVKDGSEIKNGDYLSINFTSTVPEGVTYEGGSGTKVGLVVGNNFYIPSFTDKFAGKKAGDKFDFDVTFPEDYKDSGVAGKTVTFHVEVAEHRRVILPEINSDLFKRFGIPADTDMETFRGMIKENLTHQLNQMTYSYNTTRVMRALQEANEIRIPESAVREECDRYRDRIIQENQNAAKELTSQVAYERYSARAKEQIIDELILETIIKDNNLKADEKVVAERIAEFASSYEEKDRVANFWKHKDSYLSGFRRRVEIEMVVDLVLSKSKGEEPEMNFRDYRKLVESFK